MKSASSKRPDRQAAPNAASEFRLKRDIGRRLASRFALRFHVVLIVLWSLTWGVACSKTLHWVGLDSRPWRYAVATVCAWLAMLVAFKLWLLYTGFTQRRKAQRAGAGHDSANDGASLDFDFSLPRIGATQAGQQPASATTAARSAALALRPTSNPWRAPGTHPYWATPAAWQTACRRPTRRYPSCW